MISPRILHTLTRDHPKIACTSISGDNLADGLWSELAKWLNRSDILTDQFTWTSVQMRAPPTSPARGSF
jgi:hypothetical protein